MNFKDMLETLSMLSEATKETEKGRVHTAEPGGYGRKYDTDEEGDETDGQKDTKKPPEKRGRGRPAKTGAHVSSPEEKKKQKGREEAGKTLQSMIGKAPKKSKELDKLPKKKHSLKEFFDQIDSERMISEMGVQTAIPVVGKQGDTQSTGAGFIHIDDTSPAGQAMSKALGQLAQQKKAQIVMPTQQQSTQSGTVQVKEKWAGDAKIQATGEYSKKSVEELKSMLAKLKKSGPHDADSPEAKKQRQINFALRSKGGWKKGEGAAMKEGNLSEVEQPTEDNRKAMGANLAAARNPYSLEEAKKTVKKDDKAEKAGKKVAKDIEYDEKVKDKIHGKKRHSEDEKAERAGKKVAKDIEYDEKKNNKKKVNESMHRHSSARLMGKAHALAKEAYNCRYEDMEEAKAYHDGFKEGLDECYGQGVYETAPAMPPSTIFGMADAAMEDDLDEMDKTSYMKQQAIKTPGPTFNAFGQTMYDKDVLKNSLAFESLDKQLHDLLIEGEVVEEGMSVSISKGNQGAPDSVTVSAQDSEAEKLLSFIKQTGLGLFGDESQSNYGAPTGETPKHAHGDIEVVDDHDGMMSIMKKLSGINQDNDEDYRDEEHHDDHEHEDECNECGYMESDCQCDEEALVDENQSIGQEVEEVAEDNPDDSGATDSKIGAQSEAEEDAALAAQSQQDKTYTVNEDGDEASEELDEGRMADNLKKAAAAGVISLGLAAGGNQLVKDYHTSQDVRQTQQQAPTVKIGSKDYKVFSQDLASKGKFFSDKVNGALRDKVVVTDGSGNQYYLGVSSNNGHRYSLLPTSKTKVNSPTVTVGNKQMSIISPEMTNDSEKRFGQKAMMDKMLVKDNSGNSYYLAITSSTGHNMWLVPVKSTKLDEWANQVGKGPGKGTDASFEEDIEFMTKIIAGGLNKPKATGQTTIPVIPGQDARTGYEDISAWKKLAGI